MNTRFTPAVDLGEKVSEIKEASNIHKTSSQNTLPTYQVELPSKGVFYDRRVSTVRVSPFSVLQVRQIYSALQASDPYETQSQLAATIDESLFNFSVYDLTLGDYDYIKYWIRLNTYKKSPLTLNWWWIPDQETGEKRNCVSMITETNLEVIDIEPHARPDPRFSYPTVRDYLDLVKIENPDEAYIADLAAFMAGKNLETKVNRFLPLEAADIIPDLRAHREKYFHGVSEKVKVRDEEIEGAPEVEIELVLEPSDFFP